MGQEFGQRGRNNSNIAGEGVIDNDDYDDDGDDHDKCNDNDGVFSDGRGPACDYQLSVRPVLRQYHLPGDCLHRLERREGSVQREIVIMIIMILEGD